MTKDVFTELVERSRFRHVCFMCRKGLSIETAEDIVQTAYLRAWRTRNGFSGDPSSLDAWLFGVLRNTFWQMAKKFKNERKRESDYAEKQSASGLVWRYILVREILEQLPIQQALVLRMYYFAGLNSTEIAQRLNLTVSQVKNWPRRAVKSARKLL